MKTADVEFRTQLLLRAAAQLAKLELAELVRQRLRRPGDVAIRLRLDGGFIDRLIFAEEFDHLIAAPALRVKTGVHHQAYRAE